LSFESKVLQVMVLPPLRSKPLIVIPNQISPKEFLIETCDAFAQTDKIEITHSFAQSEAI
jgi:hypothetical protein